MDLGYSNKKIVVAITGASGAIFAQRLLFHLQRVPKISVAVVCSGNAETVWRQELDDEMVLPFPVFENHDFFAPFASGSAGFQHMVIAPCSMGTLGRIATGTSNDLITRAADVVLKERRQLICMVREAPYNLIHLKNMVALTEAGGIILPCSPSYYSKPKTITELTDTIVFRALDLLGIEVSSFRWGNETPSLDA